MTTNLDFDNGYEYDVNILLDESNPSDDRVIDLVKFFQENLEKKNAIVFAFNTIAFKDRFGRVYYSDFDMDVARPVEKPCCPKSVEVFHNWVYTSESDVKSNIECVANMIEEIAIEQAKDKSIESHLVENYINSAFRERFVLLLDDDTFEEFLLEATLTVDDELKYDKSKNVFYW